MTTLAGRTVNDGAAGTGGVLSATEHRRSLRRQMPPSERLLWSRLRNRQTAGLKFRRKHGIGCYVLDFFCYEAQLAVDIRPGRSGAGPEPWPEQARLTARDKFLASLGVEVFRFTEADVYDDLEGLVMRLAEIALRRIRARLAGDQVTH